MLCPIYYKLRNVENLFEPTRFYNFFFFFFFLAGDFFNIS